MVRMTAEQRKILAEMTRTAAADGRYDTADEFVQTRPDLVTWLREQIADDQSYSEDRDTSGHCGWHEGIHLANTDVQARCEAYLRIIDLHKKAEPPYIWLCDLCRDEGQNIDCTYPCDTLRVLALAYQHRPGYREEWRL